MNKGTLLSNNASATSFRWTIMALLFLIIMVNYIDRSAISFALPHLKAQFNLSYSQLGLILGSFGISYLITITLGGIWADKYGAKKTLVVALLLWALSMFFMAAAIGFSMFVVSRILLGLAEGPIFPVKYRVGADWIPVNQRATALTYAGVGVPLAIVVGAPIISNLIYYFDWRLTFVILGVFSLIWIPLWLYFFKNTPQDSPYVNKQELDIINNIKGDTNQFENSFQRIIRFFIIPGFKDSSIIVRKQNSTSNTWKYLLGNKTLLASYWGCFVYGYFTFFFMGWLPTYFARNYHLNLKANGWFNTLPWILAIIFIIINARISDYIIKTTGKLRYARSYPIIIGVLLSTICLIILIILPQNLFVTITFISLAVAFITGVGTFYYLTSVDLVKKRAGTAVGINGIGMGLASFVSPALTGYLIQLTGSFNAGFYLLIALGLSSVIIIAIFHKPDSL
ncbi:MFS transporter [Rickettsiales bacterium LUAb2]